MTSVDLLFQRRYSVAFDARAIGAEVRPERSRAHSEVGHVRLACLISRAFDAPIGARGTKGEQMRAAVLEQTGGETLEIFDDVETLAVGPTDVKVDIKATGVCHSDLHAMNGDLPQGVPFVPGHEGAGVVSEVGSAVTSLAVGDHVIVAWSPPCGKCVACVDQNRVGRHIHRVFLTPLAQREHGRQKIAALLGKPILHLAPIVAARGALEYAVIDEPAEAVRKDIAGDPELARELLEVHESVESRAQDQERPAFAHYFERRGQAAPHGGFQILAQLGHPTRVLQFPSPPQAGRCSFALPIETGPYT